MEGNSGNRAAIGRRQKVVYDHNEGAGGHQEDKRAEYIFGRYHAGRAIRF
jgi:hypothetical protein